VTVVTVRVGPPLSNPPKECSKGEPSWVRGNAPALSSPERFPSRRAVVGCGSEENDNVSDSPFRRMIRASAPDFWRLWFVGLVVFTVRWLETVAVGVVVYQRTGSAFWSR